MFFFAGKPIHANKIRIGVTSVFFASAKCKNSFFIVTFIFLTHSVSGQYPDQDYFKQKITSIYKLKASNISFQLKKLLQFEQQVKIYKYQNDSVGMYLQRAIGIFYYKLNNYDSAIYFTNQSLSGKHC